MFAMSRMLQAAKSTGKSTLCANEAQLQTSADAIYGDHSENVA
jgi:hypothetical protein